MTFTFTFTVYKGSIGRRLELELVVRPAQHVFIAVIIPSVTTPPSKEVDLYVSSPNSLPGHLFMTTSHVGRRLTPRVRRGVGQQLQAPVLVTILVARSRGTTPAQRGDEQRPERAAEQSAHRAVQQEIDGTVDENHDVPDVTYSTDVKDVPEKNF